ncbi:amidohydrolase [Novosphingobium sp. B 225]|uniref:amidohydrolase n=1 Tax=Novosphingobium sp. B 225 TaxID=1961849 RepID=UPI000B4A9BBA|nr:amidohydrolase [Novosphingobium sp. B 225]
MRLGSLWGAGKLACAALLALTGQAALAKPAAPAKADLILYHGKFLTMDARGSVVQAVAVRDGRIVAVGSEAQMRRWAGAQTRMVDLKGQTVLPGFIDGHVHPQVAIRMKSYLDAHYSAIPTLQGMLAATRERAAATPAGEWVIVAGTSGNPNFWPEQRMPTKAELDAVGGGHPVLYVNGPHTWVVNTAGLEKMGVKPGAANQRGALIELDAAGNPTGVIREGGPLSPDARLPAELLQRYEMEDIPQLMLPLGYTSINDIMALPSYAAVRELAVSGRHPKIRKTITVFADSGGHHLPQDLAALKLPASVDPAWYRFGGIKIWADGDVPVRTGYLFGHYADEPDNHGLATNTQEELDALVAKVHAAGLGMFIHSTGDRSNVMVLDAYEKAQKAGGAKTLMRIEHLGEFMLGPQVLERTVKLGVQADIQPGWIWTLGEITRRNLGEDVARNHAFRFRTMIKAGLKPGFGTDMTGFQRGTENPFMHIEAMLTRKQKDGAVFLPEEAVSLDQALRVMTVWSARSMGEEAVKGSLEPGKFADMIVLSRDIAQTPPAEIHAITVRQTWVGGELVYSRP